ncbi:MAG: class I mannose-6-phosphate isomerase [Bradymonadales bacterium]|nr:class I mannose-6-phosphate isomerase [Bradymonadales bacterium]
MAFDQPLRMNPDNFTPPTRTPWGGRVILDRIKRGLVLDPVAARYPVVGESWEVSVEPSFPSRVVNLPDAPLLSEVIARDPSAALGPVLARRFGGSPLLIKLLDSAIPLSVQVHPDDGDPNLDAHQSGKPECWYIVDRAVDGAIYLGLKEGIDRAALQAALRREDDLSCLLNRVPVQPGDCFEIEAGTIHAIGAGVTLVEPQRVIPGKEGVTYRLWDWNRRYNEEGEIDPNGEPRALHLQQSLQAIRFDQPRGERFISQVRRYPVDLGSTFSLRRRRLVKNRHYQVEEIRGTGPVSLEINSLAAIVVVQGEVRYLGAAADPVFRGGESLVLPFAMQQAELELTDCLAIAVQPGSG